MTLKCTLSKTTLPWDRSKPLQIGMYPDLSFSAVEPAVTTITARSPPHYDCQKLGILCSVVPAHSQFYHKVDVETMTGLVMGA